MKYKLFDLETAKKLLLPEADEFGDWSDFINLLYRIDDDGSYHLLAADGGEPEDQSFWRDWNWVPEELNRLADIINKNQRRKNEH